MHSFKLNQVLSDSSLLRVQASLEKFEGKEGNMTIIPLAMTYCSVVELLLQVFALVYGSYG